MVPKNRTHCQLSPVLVRPFVLDSTNVIKILPLKVNACEEEVDAFAAEAEPWEGPSRKF